MSVRLAFCALAAALPSFASAEEKAEPQVINVDAPTASSALDRLVAQKIREEALERARAQLKVPDPVDATAVNWRWRELEASGVLSGPELQSRKKIKAELSGGQTQKDFDPLSGDATARSELSVPGDGDSRAEHMSAGPTNSQAGGTPAVRMTRRPQLGHDPEQARQPFQEQDAPASPAVSMPNAAPSKAPAPQNFNRASSPEISRLNDAEENEARQLLAPSLDTASKLALTTRRALDAQPRLASGGTMEQDDLSAPKLPLAKPVPAPSSDSELLASTMQKKAAPAKTEAASAPLDQFWKPNGVNLNGAQAQSRLPNLPQNSKTAHDGNASAGAQKGAPIPGKDEDPEVHMKQLLKDIAVLGKKLQELNKAEKERIASTLSADSSLNITNEHVLKAMSALRGAQAPGAVSVKVIDAKSKQALNSRIKIVDPTETTARSPLKDGFWCRGVTPGINVLPGLVRVEVSHGGRFSPQFVKGMNVKSGVIEPLEVMLNKVPQLDFEARGWVLADLDIGLRARPGESRVWFGAPPSLNELLLGAQAEGVRVIGLSLPLGDPALLAEIQAAVARNDSEVLVLPVYPGPRHAFNGCAAGLGIENWDGLKTEISEPELPLRDGFDLIRAQGGLAVFKDFAGGRTASVEKEILPRFGQLEHNGYFDSRVSKVRLYGAAELPFDTITGGFDLFAFDGTDESEAVWFNLLNEGAPVQVIGAGGGSLEGGRIPFGQTFIQTGGKTTRGNVLAAIQQGRTMVSFGPAAFCKIFERDMGPGAVLPTDGRPLSLQIEAYSSISQGAQLDKVEVLRNGKVVYTQNAVESEAEISDLRFPLNEMANAWYVVRVTEKLKALKGEEPVRRRAWTSPIYFRGAAFAPPRPALARVHGIVRQGLTPVRGTVTALAVGEAPVRVQTGADGSYSIQVPAAGSLVFRADDCEPVAVRIFEHERVQRALGRQLSADDPMSKLAERSVFGMWRLLLSDLEWDMTLEPEKEPQDAPKLPEPE